MQPDAQARLPYQKVSNALKNRSETDGDIEVPIHVFFRANQHKNRQPYRSTAVSNTKTTTAIAFDIESETCSVLTIPM